MEKKSFKPSNNQNRQTVRFVVVDAGREGQRIDNFLLRELKDVPRSYIYRILRKGEVRVDKKRIKPAFKLSEGQTVRVPPVYLPEKNTLAEAPQALLKVLQESIILEDENLIFINKPSGLAVHGGSGIRYGLIETFRQLRPEMSFVELVHRLDKETSGIVMLAKNRQSLLELHALLKNGGIQKNYRTLAKGRWQGGSRHIKNKLQRKQGRQQKVRVISGNDVDAKEAESIFSPVTVFQEFSLLNVELLTGRMHQIRTQLADMDHPVLGDSQYGDFGLNREVKKTFGLKRLFLHAYHLKFKLPSSGKVYDCQIPLADDLQKVVESLK
jgi:23S rRNA pseudouridine955/2504/2580 synthase